MEWLSVFAFKEFVVMLAIGLAVEVGGYYILRLKKTYPYREAWRALAIGLPGRVAWAVQILILFTLARWVEPHRLFKFSLSGPWMWIATFIAAEFDFYVTHRLQHRVNWLWADHQVHHSSTDLNVFDGDRLGWTVSLTGGFYVLLFPLVLLGFDSAALFDCSRIIAIYQFLIHSQALPRLGILEKVLNTSAHHRIHHASNAEYLDCNFGGCTILFDYFFGTFGREQAAVPLRYGLWTTEASEKNILKIAIQGWVSIARTLRKCSTGREKFYVLFGPPGWAPDGSSQTTAQIRARLANSQDARLKEAA